MVSDVFAFDHTTYYRKEMGPGLHKQFISFSNLGDRNRLVPLKLECLEMERCSMRKNLGIVNLDPAYMELPKLVVASHKNFAHRIHIAAGIFGDVQLVYRGHTFVPNEWTYPDYKRASTLDFFCRMRQLYSKTLGGTG